MERTNIFTSESCLLQADPGFCNNFINECDYFSLQPFPTVISGQADEFNFQVSKLTAKS